MVEQGKPKMWINEWPSHSLQPSFTVINLILNRLINRKKGSLCVLDDSLSNQNEQRSFSFCGAARIFVARASPPMSRWQHLDEVDRSAWTPNVKSHAMQHGAHAIQDNKKETIWFFLDFKGGANLLESCAKMK
jgi:hypothetical protein